MSADPRGIFQRGSRVLVCGDREWNDPFMIWAVLDGVYQAWEVGYDMLYMGGFTLIEGGARGADKIAHEWAVASPMHSHNEKPDDPPFRHLHFPADWRKYGNAAGPIRNQQMIDEGKPELVIAFHDNIYASKGTKDLCQRAVNAGVEVWLMQHSPFGSPQNARA